MGWKFYRIKMLMKYATTKGMNSSQIISMNEDYAGIFTIFFHNID